MLCDSAWSLMIVSSVLREPRIDVRYSPKNSKWLEALRLEHATFMLENVVKTAVTEVSVNSQKLTSKYFRKIRT